MGNGCLEPQRVSIEVHCSAMDSLEDSNQIDESKTYCDSHSDIESELRCNRCERIICPKCMVQSPVGIRCSRCDKASRINIAAVGYKDYLLAIIATLLMASITGFAWAYLRFAFWWFPSWLVALFVGYMIGESISVSANRKRSRVLAIIAGFGVVLAFVFAGMLSVNISIRYLMFTVLSLGLAIYIAVSRVR